MNRTLKVFIAAVTGAITVLATGCGGSAYSPGVYGSPAKTSVPSSVGVARIGVANTKLGRIVVDRTGRTLYLFERDKTVAAPATEHARRSGRRCSATASPSLALT
jgi:hypothetical protein